MDCAIRARDGWRGYVDGLHRGRGSTSGSSKELAISNALCRHVTGVLEPPGGFKCCGEVMTLRPTKRHLGMRSRGAGESPDHSGGLDEPRSTSFTISEGEISNAALSLNSVVIVG